jgi:hypothetical protein
MRSALQRENLALQAAHLLSRLPLPVAPRRATFIIGCARSGTSVLKRVLGRHPEIAALPSEANDLWHPGLYPWQPEVHTVPPLWLDPWSFTRASVEGWPGDHGTRIARVFGLYQRLMGRPVLLNKSSMINFMLPEVERLFPGARFIHIIRDGRAVALSYAHKEHRKMRDRAAAYAGRGLEMDFDALCRRMATMWAETLGEIDTARAALGWDAQGCYFECRYEDFCDQPNETGRAIAGFLGVDPNKVRLGEAIADKNHKFREQLAPSMLADLSRIIAPALTARSYPVRPD